MTAAQLWNMPAADGQTFDVASVRPAVSTSVRAWSGGPGTADPVRWHAANVPVSVVIAKAFGFREDQFSTHDSCCLASFDFDAKISEGTTADEFSSMLRNLLRNRFKLAFHFKSKETIVYELAVGPNGSKLKSSTGRPECQSDHPVESPDRDGYPVFPAGCSQLAGNFNHYRWTAFNGSAQEIAATLSAQMGHPLTNATGLDGKYDIDLKWVNDVMLSERSKAIIKSELGEIPEMGSGPRLLRAVPDQLGLKIEFPKRLN